MEQKVANIKNAITNITTLMDVMAKQQQQKNNDIANLLQSRSKSYTSRSSYYRELMDRATAYEVAIMRVRATINGFLCRQCLEN